MCVRCQDCTCLSGCKYCAIELRLDVVCNENRTMEVTSHHLEVVEFMVDTASRDNTIQEGDEVAKRGEGFGNPVGKGTHPSCAFWPVSMVLSHRRCVHAARSHLQDPQRTRAAVALHRQKGIYCVATLWR